MTLQDLKLRVRALLAPHRMEQELDDELAFHIECETRKLVQSGIDPDAARQRALARFGSVALAADRCRDERGTSFVDNTTRDVLYAFRMFRRAPLFAVTVVLTVGLGLGLVTVVFTVMNAFFFRTDAVRNPHELFAVERPPYASAGRVWMPFLRPEYEAMRRETTVFTDAAAMIRYMGIRVDGRAAHGSLVSGNFFQLVGVEAATGRALVPPDDVVESGRPVIVLSHHGWTKLFAQDPSVVGRHVPVNGVLFEIVGVMPDGFRGLRLSPPDFWAPLALVGHFDHDRRGKESEIPLDVIGRLPRHVSPQAAAAALASWGTGSPDLKKMQGQAAAFFRLKPSRGTLATDRLESLAVFWPLMFSFGLILLIGCANVANLLLARGVTRAREIGVRLALGSSRARLVRQLITENLLLALMAAVCGLGISRALLSAAIYLGVTSLPPEMAESMNLVDTAADWRVFTFLLVGAIVSTLLFGLVPALHATRLELTRTMKGDIAGSARPGSARGVLIGLQVTASALLLICAAVFLRSALAASRAMPSLRTNDTVMLEIANEPRRAAMLQAIQTDPLIAQYAASSPGPLGVLQAASLEVAGGGSPEWMRTNRLIEYQFVSPDYLELLGIEVVRGRGFTTAERSADAGVVVVSESVARKAWGSDDVVGQVLRLKPVNLVRNEGRPELPARSYSVVGVVRDVRNATGLFDFTNPGVYVPIARDSAATVFTLQVRGDPALARQTLLDRLGRVDPGTLQMMTLRTAAEMNTVLLERAFWASVFLGGLALTLTLSGLFSVLSYLVEQRRHEIGVRMALGADPGSVARLVLSQTVRPVGIGLVAGGALATSLATVLLATPFASHIGSVVRVLDPVAYAASLFVIVVACIAAAGIPARRAARIDPMLVLREE
jgi:predicted permease